jgi:hypothetical protein
MRQAILLTAITLALFCALSAIFYGVAMSTPQPTKKAPSAPETKRVWT